MLTSAREYKWSVKDGNRIDWSITAEETGAIYESDHLRYTYKI